MIHILFYGGSFGTTIEYCLKRFSIEFSIVSIDDVALRDDGSMHSYQKEYHPITLKQIKGISKRNAKITTPVYPNFDAGSEEVIRTFKQSIQDHDQVIFIVLKNNIDYSKAMLLLFNKSDYRKCLDIIGSNCKQWNENYNSTVDLKPWELREYYSFIHRDLCPEVIDVGTKFEKNWFVVSIDDIISNFVPVIKQMMTFLNLTLKDENKLIEFYAEWSKHQNDIINEYKIINTIIDKLLKKEYYTWTKLSLMAESLVQFELLNLGIKLKVFNLDEFPTDTNKLLSLIA